MIIIVVKDNKNKGIEVLMHLRDETELFICDNINTINNALNRDFQIETYVEGIEEYRKQRGYKIEQGLYDKLIIEYNQQSEQLLTRWK